MTSHKTMTLDDEMPWIKEFGEPQDFYDDIGFTLTAETDEHDILVGDFIYFFHGGPERPKSLWLADGLAHNTLVVITPKSQRGKGLYNNPFSRTGMNIPEYYRYEDLKVTRTDTSVTWQLGDIEYVCAPPVWHLRGKHGEVEYNLTYRQADAPVNWSFGPRENGPKTGMAGGYVYLTCEGSLTVAGKNYPIKNASGVHERLAFSEALDPVANVAIDKTGFGSSFSSHLFTKDIKIWGLGHYDDPMFFVTVEGKDMTFIQSQNNATVKHELLEPWFDPRSGLSMPGRCHTYLKSEEGTLELDVQGIGRAYYPWELKRGYQIMFWILAVGNGTFTYPDGRQVIIKDELVHQEFVKLLVVHQETMAGPVLTPPEGWRARSHG